jgi:hypothetical protein
MHPPPPPPEITDRSRLKAYERHVATLGDLGIKMSCSCDPRALDCVGEVEVKVKAMQGVIKNYKILTVKGEQAITKDCLIIGILAILLDYQ